MPAGKNLTQKQRQLIWEAIRYRDVTKTSVAKQYGISPRTVGRIVEEMCLKNACSVEEDISEPDDFALFDDAELEDVWNDDIFWDNCDESEESVSVAQYELVLTGSVLTITKESDPCTDVRAESITNDDSRFHQYKKDLLAAVDDEDEFQDVMARIYSEISAREQIKTRSWGQISLDEEAGQLTHTCPVSGEVLNFSHKLFDRVLNAIKQNELDGLLAFINHVSANDDMAVAERLYDFIEPNDIEIDDEGYVICYKKVNSEFRDIQTNTIDNSLNATPEIKRKHVNPDHNQTCSFGLHVCSWSYLDFYGISRENRIIRVRVHPRDFVAIPYDYNNAKARVCRYEVIGVIE